MPRRDKSGSEPRRGEELYISEFGGGCPNGKCSARGVYAARRGPVRRGAAGGHVLLLLLLLLRGGGGLCPCPCPCPGLVFLTKRLFFHCPCPCPPRWCPSLSVACPCPCPCPCPGPVFLTNGSFFIVCVRVLRSGAPLCQWRVRVRVRASFA